MAKEKEEKVVETAVQEAVYNKEEVAKVLDRIKTIEEKNTLLGKLDAELQQIAQLKSAESEEFASKQSERDAVKKEIEELEFKQSELKPVLEAVTKEFERVLRDTEAHEYHIDVVSAKYYKQLRDYIEHDIAWTAETSAPLVQLYHEFKANAEWVKSTEFDGVIILHTRPVLTLYDGVNKKLEGKGYFEAQRFFELWTQVGKNIADTVGEIRNAYTEARELGDTLNKIDTAFEHAIRDLADTDEKQVSTKDEVEPEV